MVESVVLHNQSVCKINLRLKGERGGGEEGRMEGGEEGEMEG